MRMIKVVLVLCVGLGSVVQAYANTQLETHCRLHGHTSAMAPDGAHDPVHAARHSGGSSAHDGHAAGHAPASDQLDPCDCGCMCGTAGVIAAALLPSLLVPVTPRPDHLRTVISAGHAHAEHSAPQRPPAVLS
jgi:hypothetical protein